MQNLTKDITNILNIHCRENESNTPDFLLAEYLIECLKNFDNIIEKRDKWYNVKLEPANSHFLNNE